MLQNCQAPIVVAVVGLGHVEGIKKCWGKQIDIAALKQIPSVWSFRKVFFYHTCSYCWYFFNFDLFDYILVFREIIKTRIDGFFL